MFPVTFNNPAVLSQVRLASPFKAPASLNITWVFAPGTGICPTNLRVSSPMAAVWSDIPSKDTTNTPDKVFAKASASAKFSLWVLSIRTYVLYVNNIPDPA